MRLAEYVTASAATAIYPASFALAYPALGLAGEAAEVCDAVGSGFADDVLAELGDVCWYLAAVCRDAGIDPAELAGRDSDGGTATLVRAAGIVAEQVKKTVRGGDRLPPAERRARIVDALATVYATVDRIARDRGSDAERVMAANLAKLTDRADRGVLHGDGDRR